MTLTSAALAWQDSLDPELVARLLARQERFGLIGCALASRILAQIEAMSGRLPLLARFAAALREGFASGVPIVHTDGSWSRPEPPLAEPLPSRAASGSVRLVPAPVQVVGARSVERTTLRERLWVETSAVEPAPAHSAIGVPLVPDLVERPPTGGALRNPFAPSAGTPTGAEAAPQGLPLPNGAAPRMPRAEEFAAVLIDAPGAPVASQASLLPAISAAARVANASVRASRVGRPLSELESARVAAPVQEAAPAAELPAPLAFEDRRRPADSVDGLVVVRPIARVTAAQRDPEQQVAPISPVLGAARELADRVLARRADSTRVVPTGTPLVRPQPMGTSADTRAPMELTLVRPAPIAAARLSTDASAQPSSPQASVTPPTNIRRRENDSAPSAQAKVPPIDLTDLAGRVQLLLDRRAMHERARRGLPR